MKEKKWENYRLGAILRTCEEEELSTVTDLSNQQDRVLNALERKEPQRHTASLFNPASTFFGILRDDVISNADGRLRGGMHSGEETKDESKEEKKTCACYGALPKDLLKQLYGYLKFNELLQVMQVNRWWHYVGGEIQEKRVPQPVYWEDKLNRYLEWYVGEHKTKQGLWEFAYSCPTRTPILV